MGENEIMLSATQTGFSATPWSCCELRGKFKVHCEPHGVESIFLSGRGWCKRALSNPFAYDSIFQLHGVLRAWVSEKKTKTKTKTKTNQRATESCVCAGCIWRVSLFTFHPARSYGLRGNSPKPLFICSASCFYLCLKTNGQINKWFVFHRLLFFGAPILSCSNLLLKKLKSYLAWESGSVSPTTKQGGRFKRQTKQTAGFLESTQWFSLGSLKSKKKKKLRKRQHSNFLIWFPHHLFKFLTRFLNLNLILKKPFPIFFPCKEEQWVQVRVACLAVLSSREMAAGKSLRLQNLNMPR